MDDAADGADATTPMAEVTINCAWACCQSQAVDKTIPTDAAAENCHETLCMNDDSYDMCYLNNDDDVTYRHQWYQQRRRSC